MIKNKKLFILFFSIFFLFSFSSISKDLKDYRFIKIDDLLRNSEFNKFVNDTPTMKDYINFNLYTFDVSSSSLNHKVLNYGINTLGQPLFTVNTFGLFYNINREVSGGMSIVLAERNVIQQRLKSIEFFNNLKNFKETSKEEYMKLIDYNWFNELALRDYTEYNFEEMKMSVNFKNEYEFDIKTGLFCDPDFKLAYIFSHFIQSSGLQVESLNSYVPIYIYLTEEMQNIFTAQKGNICSLDKKFNSHEDAIKYYNLLQDGKSRFLIKFKINQKQFDNALFLEATATEIGLYEYYYGELKPFDVIYNNNFEEKSVSDSLRNILIQRSKLDFPLPFILSDFFSRDFFYSADIITTEPKARDSFFIKFDYLNRLAYVKQNDFKAIYRLEKNSSNYYSLSLHEIHQYDRLDIPRELELYRKVDGLVLISNSTYYFRNRIYNVNFLNKYQMEF